MGVQLYCNVDAEGIIIDSLIGERVIPMQQYDFFFYLVDMNEDAIISNIPNYRIINRELVLE